MSVSKTLMVFRGSYSMQAINILFWDVYVPLASKGSSVPFAVIISVHWLHPFLQPHTLYWLRSSQGKIFTMNTLSSIC